MPASGRGPIGSRPFYFVRGAQIQASGRVLITSVLRTLTSPPPETKSSARSSTTGAQVRVSRRAITS